MSSSASAPFSLRYYLNTQTISDNLSNLYECEIVHAGPNRSCLETVRFYREEAPLLKNTLYLTDTLRLPETFRFQDHIHYLLLGPLPAFSLPFPDSCGILRLRSEVDPFLLFNEISTIFERYRIWDSHLHDALHAQNPIEDLIESSLEIFKNPIFVHDQNFYILSSPRHAPGMSVWTRDSRTGKTMVPFSLVQEFKTDLEYLHTLGTHGASLFSRELRGYRIMYINLWNDHIYQGRICINEMQSPLQLSQYHALEYLATFVEYCLERHYQFHLNVGKDIRAFLSDYLNGNVPEQADILSAIEIMNWKRYDHYLCFRLENIQNRRELVSSASILEQIEYQIPDGSAFYYEGGITVIVNLSTRKSQSANVISAMAIILREGLFKMGTSCEFHDFLLFPQAARQAKITLELGKQSESMSWHYRFDDYFLPYIKKVATTSLSPLMICSRKLLILMNYDKENSTELYHTLDVYLNLERNVLQTAKKLFIHRSTLFYRLERIVKLTKVNLDDPKERLNLLLSYELLKDAN